MVGMKNIGRIIERSVCVCAVCGSPLSAASGCMFCNEHLTNIELLGGCAT
jgi:hypothetical protein